MKQTTLSSLCRFLGVLLVWIAMSSPALAVAPVASGLFDNVAVKGYDPVAYFTAGEPAKGSKKIAHKWQGVDWRFATEANRKLFVAEPERYAPQYGGYCAWAVSRGDTASIDPNAWKIVDGKLYLNYSKKIQKQWEEDIGANIEAADGHWPQLLKK